MNKYYITNNIMNTAVDDNDEVDKQFKLFQHINNYLKGKKKFF